MIRFSCILAALLAGAAPAQSWKRVQGLDSARGVYTTAVHGGIFYAATDSLVSRSGDGISWTPTASQPVQGLPYYVLEANDSGLYAGTFRNGVYRTRDGGQTWTPVGSGLPNEDVLALATLGDSLYAGLGFSGIYVLNLKSPGAWAAHNGGLTQFGTNSLSVARGRLFAGLGNNLFVRDRGGAQWTEAVIGAGLQRQFYDVAASGAYFLGASSNGVYRADTANPAAWQAADIAGLSGRHVSALVVRGARAYASVNYQGQHWIWSTDNAGASCDVRAHEFAEAYEMRFAGDRMWVARSDGLWYYDFEPAALKPRPAPLPRAFPASTGRRVDGRRSHGDERRSTEITLRRSP
jgi:ligand-binding sensor domain-containing protein